LHHDPFSLSSLFSRWPALRWSESEEYEDAAENAERELNVDPTLCEKILECQRTFDRANAGMEIEDAFLRRFTTLCGSAWCERKFSGPLPTRESKRATKNSARASNALYREQTRRADKRPLEGCEISAKTAEMNNHRRGSYVLRALGFAQAVIAAVWLLPAPADAEILAAIEPGKADPAVRLTIAGQPFRVTNDLGSITSTRDAKTLFVVHFNEERVSVVNADTGAVSAQLPVSRASFAIAPDGSCFTGSRSDGPSGKNAPFAMWSYPQRLSSPTAACRRRFGSRYRQQPTPAARSSATLCLAKPWRRRSVFGGVSSGF
jgi:hypothetical protein